MSAPQVNLTFPDGGKSSFSGGLFIVSIFFYPSLPHLRSFYPLTQLLPLPPPSSLRTTSSFHLNLERTLTLSIHPLVSSTFLPPSPSTPRGTRTVTHSPKLLSSSYLLIPGKNIASVAEADAKDVDIAVKAARTCLDNSWGEKVSSLIGGQGQEGTSRAIV